MTDYLEFLRSKIEVAPVSGFDVDPFGGLGTVALEAMKAGRRGYTIELNNSYFRDAVGCLKAEEEKLETPTLFDLIGGA